MQLNDRTDFGLRVLLLLGGAAPARIPARTIAAVHRLSYTHLQKVIQELEAAGFVDTRRGRSGGVSLALPPEEIRIGDVIRAMEPHLDLVRCFRHGDRTCVLTGGCGLASALRRGLAAFLEEMDAVSLGDVIATSPAMGLIQLEGASNPVPEQFS